MITLELIYNEEIQVKRGTLHKLALKCAENAINEEYF